MKKDIYVLGPVTSLLIWRAAMLGAIDDPGNTSAYPDLSRARASVREIRSLSCVRQLRLDSLDAIVGDAKRAHACRTLDTIVIRRRLPEGSFRSLEGNVYICSPELCFVLLGRGGLTTHLLEIGCELCGTYSMTYRQDGAFGNTPALTSVKSLAAFVEKVRRRHGVSAARQALDLIADGSDSPRETALFLSMTLPCRMGGYGIRKPILNGELDLSERSQRTVGKRRLVVDQLYLDEGGKPVAVGEYDSDEHHLVARGEQGGKDVDVAKILSDDARREVIRDEGIDMVTFRTEDTRSFERYEAKVMRMGRLVDCKPHPSTGRLRNSRITLLKSLFGASRWESEHDVLRTMAGYERHIRHRKQSDSARKTEPAALSPATSPDGGDLSVNA